MVVWSVYWAEGNEAAELVDIVVSPPVLSELIPNTWECSISIPMSRMESRPIFGATPLQSLSLAISLVRSELKHWAEKGSLVEAHTHQPMSPEAFATEVNCF